MVHTCRDELGVVRIKICIPHLICVLDDSPFLPGLDFLETHGPILSAEYSISPISTIADMIDLALMTLGKGQLSTCAALIDFRGPVRERDYKRITIGTEGWIASFMLSPGHSAAPLRLCLIQARVIKRSTTSRSMAEAVGTGVSSTIAAEMTPLMSV